MADTFRIVNIAFGGRPVSLLDLNDLVGYARDRDAGLTFTPAPPTVQYSRQARRYGGGRPVGVTHDNAGLGWTAFVKDATYAATVGRVEALAAQVDEVAAGRFVQWTPQGGLSSYMEVAGPGTWTPAYDPVQFQQTLSIRVAVTLPVMPLVRWDAMTIRDGSEAGAFSIADYVFDAMTPADVSSVTQPPFLAAAGVLTTERRARNTARGYTHVEGESTTEGTVGATITSFKLGAIVRASDANNYVEGYVDDNGTNSRLRIDLVVAGVRTNRATVNLAARMVAAAQVAVRVRVEGTTVIAEHFIDANVDNTNWELTEPATTSTSYTLAAGTEQALPAGYGGWSWIPQASGARLNQWRFLPHVRRGATLPATFTLFSGLSGTVVRPALGGRASALMDVSLTQASGGTQPLWAQVGWADFTDGSATPFGLFEAESAASLTTWATSVQAGASGGSDIRATAAGAGTYAAYWTVDLSSIAPDDFGALASGTVDLEVWARVLLTGTLVNPRLTVSFTQGAGVTTGQQFTAEYGNIGKLLTVPSSGTVYRPARLGTVTVPKQGGSPALLVAGAVDTGSTGAFGLDYVWVVPARRRALGPTGVAGDATYPVFLPSTAAWRKRIRSDLSATLSAQSTPLPNAGSDHGLSGSLLEVPSGTPKVWVKLSSVVPDDPTASTVSEATTHTMGVHLDLVPRSRMLRDQ